MRKALKLLVFGLALGLLFLPSLVSAHDFSRTDGLFFNIGTALYRQKSPDRSWQLVNLPNLTVKQTAVFEDRLYLVVEANGSQSLYIQDESLKFTLDPIVRPETSLTLKTLDGWLAIFGQTDSSEHLYVSNGSGLRAVSTPLLSSASELDRLVVVDQQLYWLSSPDSTTAVFRYQGEWLLTTTVPCGQSVVLTRPQLLLACSDDRFFYPQTPANWLNLGLPPVSHYFTSASLIVGWDKVDPHLAYVWRSGQLVSIALPQLAYSQVEQVVVSYGRVFIRSASLWYELGWQEDPPLLSQLSILPDLALVDPDSNGQVFLSGSASLWSTQPGSWQPLTVQGSFNHAQLTSLGWLVWSTVGTTGSLTQFAANGSTVFAKVNPWSSTTSPIQAVFLSGDVDYISISNSSGNANLYKSTDLVHWSRLTLPTKPTLSLSIVEARTVSAGTLVELRGILTVPPGVVAGDVAYLEDDQAGIQVFLSKTIGNLPVTINRLATVTGEMSSSQAKRVGLASAADLEISSPAELNSPAVNADEAANFLGRSARLRGNVDETDSDSLLLHQLFSHLKFHFDLAKTIFQVGDSVSAPAVIDWNSSSGQVEAWATSSSYELLSRLTAPTLTASSTVATTSQHSAKTVAGSSSLPVVKTAVSQKLPNPTTQSSLLVGAQTTSTPLSTQQTIVLAITGLLAGLLAMTGHRFRRLLDWQ